MINKKTIYGFFLTLFMVCSTHVICAELSGELAILPDSLRKNPAYDAVKLTSPDIDSGAAASEIEELRLDSRNLGSFKVANVPDNKGIIFVSNLCEVRKDSLGSLCYALLKIARERDLREIRFLNGSSLKFNGLFPTIKEVFEEYCHHQKHLVVFYSADRNGTQTQKAAHEGMSHLVHHLGGLTMSPKEMKAIEGRDVMGVRSPSSAISRTRSSSETTEEDTISLSSFANHVEDLLEYQEDFEFSQNYEWNDEDGEPYCGIHSIYNFKRFSSEDQKPADWLRDIDLKAEVKALDLSQAAIGDSSIKDVIKQCSRFSNLTVLDLSFNPLTTQSFEDIFEFLQNHNTLRFIDITYSELMDNYPDGPENLIAYFESKGRKDLIEKLIWYGISEEVINGKFHDLLPVEYRELCVKSHLLYSKVNRLLAHIQERLEIRDDLTKNFGIDY